MLGRQFRNRCRRLPQRFFTSVALASYLTAPIGLSIPEPLVPQASPTLARIPCAAASLPNNAGDTVAASVPTRSWPGHESTAYARPTGLNRYGPAGGILLDYETRTNPKPAATVQAAVRIPA